MPKCEGMDCRDCPICLDVNACPYWRAVYVDMEAYYYMRKHYTSEQIAQIEKW